MFYLPQSFLATLASRNESQAPETSGEVWSKEELPLVDENQVQELSKYVSHWCLMNTPRNGKRAAQCHCEAMLSYFWKVAVPPLSLVFLNTQLDKALSNAVWN